MNNIIIQGLTTEGQKFRPSDWAERMSGLLSTFGQDHRIYYSPLLRPITLDGIRCIAIDPTLLVEKPEVYHDIMNFVETNHLSIIG